MTRMQQKMDDVREEPPTDGIECTPEGLVKSVAGCFGFLLSVVMVVALCLTAVGMFWTAQNLDRVTTHINWEMPPAHSGLHAPSMGQYVYTNQHADQITFCKLLTAHHKQSNNGNGFAFQYCNQVTPLSTTN